MSNEKNVGWLGYIVDEKLPSYIGIILLDMDSLSFKLADPASVLSGAVSFGSLHLLFAKIAGYEVIRVPV